MYLAYILSNKIGKNLVMVNFVESGIGLSQGNNRSRGERDRAVEVN